MRLGPQTRHEGSNSNGKPTDPKQVVAESDRAVDEGDVDALEAVRHPHMLTHSFGPSMPQGLDGMRTFVSERSSSGAGGRWTHVVTVAKGEYAIAYGTRVHN